MMRTDFSASYEVRPGYKSGLFRHGFKLCTFTAAESSMQAVSLCPFKAAGLFPEVVRSCPKQDKGSTFV
jgi:hypothetical protein